MHYRSQKDHHFFQKIWYIQVSSREMSIIYLGMFLHPTLHHQDCFIGRGSLLPLIVHCCWEGAASNFILFSLKKLYAKLRSPGLKVEHFLRVTFYLKPYDKLKGAVWRIRDLLFVVPRTICHYEFITVGNEPRTPRNFPQNHE